MLSILSKNKLHVYLFSIMIFLMTSLSQSACHIYRILGTTTLEPINSNRLDYYYSISPNQDGITKQQHIILVFDNNGELNHYIGDFVLKNLPVVKKQ